MQNKNSKSAIVLAIFFELILVLTAIIYLIIGYKKSAFIFILAMVCLSIPFITTYLANKKELLLPPRFQLVSLIFIFSAQYLGEIIGFYQRFWWWDLFLHGVAGPFLVIFAIYLTENIIIISNDSSLNRFLVFKSIWALSFTTLLGVLWEAFELVGDYFFDTHMVKGELPDSVTDLSIKVTLALIASAIYYLKNREKAHD